MSRYVQIELRGATLDGIEAALRQLSLPVERPPRRVRLQGSLECVGDPVDLRLPAGTFDTVEDFGFALERGVVRLICGELDRSLLDETLLPDLERARAEATVRTAAGVAGMRVTDTLVEPDGTRRVVLEVDEG
ncbi:MAG: hypothetical protein AAGA54_25195 [Myxococcota bacterium]